MFQISRQKLLKLPIALKLKNIGFEKNDIIEWWDRLNMKTQLQNLIPKKSSFGYNYGGEHIFQESKRYGK